MRDILRTVLRDINRICLREDKPIVEVFLFLKSLKATNLILTSTQVEQNLLYNRLTELEEYQYDPLYLKYFNLLVDLLKKTYTSITKRLTALLKGHEITYDLLWALFKPNIVVYTTYYSTGKPRYIKYYFGEERKMDNNVKYFHLEYYYVDFDSKASGETSIELAIIKFRGTKRINSLDAFPLEYHPNKNEIKAHLVEYSRKFMSLIGVHHR